MKTIIIAFAIFAALGVRHAHAQCTDEEVSGGYCFDCSDPRNNNPSACGPYWGCLVLAGGTQHCDAWHGYGDQAGYNAAQQLITTVARPKGPDASCWYPKNSYWSECCAYPDGETCCYNRDETQCERSISLIWNSVHISCVRRVGLNQPTVCQAFVN